LSPTLATSKRAGWVGGVKENPFTC